MGVNGVAPGEHAALAAFRNLGRIGARAHAILDPNLETLRRYFQGESRLRVVDPPGGNVCFPRLPRGLDAGDFCQHLLRTYGTLVVPGRFFEAPRHVRLSFGCAPGKLARGLRNMSRTLDDLAAGRD
jgi:aspartate/methionine/tyrosine aminotransferase